MNDEFENLKLTSTHEWVRVRGKSIVIGITDYAQQSMSDITSIELPEPERYEAGEELGVIESVRTSVDFHAPVSGVVTKINTELLSSPELINTDPFGAGWILEMKPESMSDVAALLDFDEYEAELPEDEE